MEKDTARAHSNAKQAAKATITINGKRYDAASGQLIDAVNNRPLPKTRQYGGFDIKPAGSLHAAAARSQTPRRSGLSKPAGPHHPLARHTRTISPAPTHPLVTRYARPSDRHVVSPSAVLSSINQADAADRPTGYAAQVQNYTPAASIGAPHKKPAAPKGHAVTAHQLKHAPTRAQRSAEVERGWKRFQKRIRLNPPLIITGSIILVLIASVICYLTIPALSLFVAAKSAGVDATYPNYVPAAYHFDGPVTYRDGEVAMKFTGNGSGASFTLTQKKSHWDSAAVLDNYVLARSPSYLTYSQSGITVYTFGSSAAWMNAGVLHTIDGSAPLTSDQILRIAGSM